MNKTIFLVLLVCLSLGTVLGWDNTTASSGESSIPSNNTVNTENNTNDTGEPNPSGDNSGDSATSAPSADTSESNTTVEKTPDASNSSSSDASQGGSNSTTSDASQGSINSTSSDADASKGSTNSTGPDAPQEESNSTDSGDSSDSGVGSSSNVTSSNSTDSVEDVSNGTASDSNTTTTQPDSTDRVFDGEADNSTASDTSVGDNNNNTDSSTDSANNNNDDMLKVPQGELNANVVKLFDYIEGLTDCTAKASTNCTADGDFTQNDNSTQKVYCDKFLKLKSCVTDNCDVTEDLKTKIKDIDSACAADNSDNGSDVTRMSTLLAVTSLLLVFWMRE